MDRKGLVGKFSASAGRFTSLGGPMCLPGPGITKMLRCALFLCTLQDLVLGQNIGPRYRPTTRFCTKNEDCTESTGEVCWWFYDGCEKGECRCDPRNSFLDSSGFCRPLKLGEEECSTGDKCPEGMSCIGGVCLCDQGEMTPDKSFCLRKWEKLLGHKCTFDKDICYQKATHGYTRNEVSCSISGVCRCNEGYKQDSEGCRKWNVFEPGCSKDHHCQGGALCIDNMCKCPSGYLAVAGDSKCAKKGAKYDLGIGEMCDEMNEHRYCAKNLICHRCAGENENTCVQFIQAQARRSVTDNAGVPPSGLFSSTLALLISIFVPLLTR